MKLEPQPLLYDPEAEDGPLVHGYPGAYPLAPYYPPRPPVSPMRAAMGDELGRGIVRGGLSLLPGIVAVGVAGFIGYRLVQSVRAWWARTTSRDPRIEVVEKREAPPPKPKPPEQEAEIVEDTHGVTVNVLAGILGQGTLEEEEPVPVQRPRKKRAAAGARRARA